MKKYIIKNVDEKFYNAASKARRDADTIARESLQFIARILLITELDRAEKERTTLSKRTKDGIAAHRAEAEQQGREWHCGRPVGTIDKMTPELEEAIRSYLRDRSIKGISIIKQFSISRNTFNKYVKIVSAEQPP